MRALYFLLLLLPTAGHAQFSEDISGTWSGLLFQNEGGFADQFELHFDVEQIGLSLKGTAYVKLGELEAEMKLSGYQSPNGSWRLSETEIIRHDKAGLEVSWCMKEYDLRVDYRQGELILTGPWWGNSTYGPCIQGSIVLRRRVKVASVILLGGQYAVDVQPHGQVHNRHHRLDGRLAVRGDKHAVATARTTLQLVLQRSGIDTPVIEEEGPLLVDTDLVQTVGTRAGRRIGPARHL